MANEKSKADNVKILKHTGEKVRKSHRSKT